jgi:divalent metal cation (Fe/Co/Zn/Cd) transporter
MDELTHDSSAAITRSVHRVQLLTIAWMLIEAGVALVAAWLAGSAVLLAFGGDSAIELISAGVVLWRFRSPGDRGEQEKRAARITGALLLFLAAYVAAISVMDLLGHGQPDPSYAGIAILMAAAVIMPWLARTKRRLSADTGSAALRADAAQSGVCGYLSVIALVGVVVNAIWHASWADPVAALAITPIILREAREAFHGRPCETC